MSAGQVMFHAAISGAGNRAGENTHLPVYSVTKHHGFVPSKEYFKKTVHSKNLSTYKVVRKGQMAYATIHLDEGSVGIAPEDCLVSPMYTVFQVDDNLADVNYILELLKSPRMLQRYHLIGAGSVHRRRSISLTALQSISESLPPLDVQQRIARTLNKNKDLVNQSRNRIRHLEALRKNVIREHFARLECPKVLLDEVAEVSSGITKGRKTPAQEFLRAVPFMTVSNVQAGRLDLSNVKSIDASEAEIERYKLRCEDILLTEGGDPDKLGRGTLWRDELPESIHQNHIFRVRVRDTLVIEPQYLMEWLGSEVPRHYFLRSAKQTTGIASINMRQLRATPVVVPLMHDQHELLSRVHALDTCIAKEREYETLSRELYASLQYRAFRGEL